MKKLTLRIFTFMLFIVFLWPSMAFASEYFLFDAEENKILFMDEDDLNFTEKMDLEKVPDLLMKTSDPDKYLAIYGPEKSEDGTESNLLANLFKKTNEKRASIAGRLILFNVKTGRTEDVVDIGYAPFNWEYTEDRRHFFITYRVSAEKDSGFELLHYNIPEMTCQTVELPASTVKVNQIAINQELGQVYLLLDNVDRIDFSRNKQKISGQPQLLTVNIGDLQVKASTPLDNPPLSLRLLSKDRGVLICQDWKVNVYFSNGQFKRYLELGEGSVVFMDLQEQKPLEKYDVDKRSIYWQWFPEDKVYIIHYETPESGLKTNSHFLKITKDGVESKVLTEEVLDFDYYPEEDKLYILHKDKLSWIDYQTKQMVTYHTGSNLYKKSPYSFRKLPDSDLALIYSVRDGKVKFYDLKRNKVERKVLSGRTWGKVAYLFRTMLSRPQDALTRVSTNADLTRFYVYNRMSNDITVYDRSFRPQKYIVTPEPALGIYQITKPTLKTLVFTGKKIYELVDQELKLVHSFEKKTDRIAVVGEENRVMIVSETELLVLHPDSLQTETRIKFFVGRDEKYTKLKAGDQRFYFIETL